jgi:Ala-tRNA(Pro) deacylase
LTALAALLNETCLSFGDEISLSEKLNIQSGSVSFLNAIYREQTGVAFLIDKSVFDYEYIGVHPNDNTATIIFSPKDIAAVLESCGVLYQFI